LGWITKFTDYKDFINKAALLNQKQEGVKQKLVGFTMIEKGIPRQHYEITDASGNIIGEVTSGTMSPTLKIGIGMGYVNREHSAPDSEINIMVRNKPLKARVVKLPFYKG
jgi:aminomethyltransferase